MDSYNETISLGSCPKCGQPHEYYLKVERSIVMKWMGGIGSSERSKRVSVTRIFTCPVKKEKFQARITLYETSNDKIKNVEVGGVVG